jgi:hypothetical protein
MNVARDIGQELGDEVVGGRNFGKVNRRIALGLRAPLIQGPPRFPLLFQARGA